MLYFSIYETVFKSNKPHCNITPSCTKQQYPNGCVTECCKHLAPSKIHKKWNHNSSLILRLKYVVSAWVLWYCNFTAVSLYCTKCIQFMIKQAKWYSAHKFKIQEHNKIVQEVIWFYLKLMLILFWTSSTIIIFLFYTVSCCYYVPQNWNGHIIPYIKKGEKT